MRKNIFKIFLIGLFLSFSLLFNIQCGGSGSSEKPVPSPSPVLDPNCTKNLDTSEVMCEFNFDESVQGWEGGFADYSILNERTVNSLEKSHALLPPSEYIFPHSGSFKISGYNANDDLFMYLKKRISGLDPNKKYRIIFEIQFASNLYFTIGGGPNGGNQDIYLKAGATLIEPETVEKNESNTIFYRINIDKSERIGGNGSDGRDMVVIGDVLAPGEAEKFCDRLLENCKYKLITRDNLQKPFFIQTDTLGDIWAVIGTDSGHGNATQTLYYNNIKIRFLEQ